MSKNTKLQRKFFKYKEIHEESFFHVKKNKKINQNSWKKNSKDFLLRM